MAWGSLDIDRAPWQQWDETMPLIQQYLSETWALIAEMGPYLLLGFLVAGLLHRWFRQEWIEQRLGSPGWKSTAFASLIGVPMPLCSCGVIPVTASLRAKGASKGAATSFLTSTPQTGIDSILVTYGMLGPLFAIYRVVTAFLSGFVIGSAVEKFGRKDEHFEEHAEKENRDRIPTWKQSAQYGFLTLPGDIAGSLTIGFLLAGLISAMAPDNLLANLPGGVYSSILLTTLIATPFYICSTGSIPLALALIESGLPVSAALVLLIAGPATNIATITTMRTTLGNRETFIYVSSIVVFSWVAALFFHEFLDTGEFQVGHHHLHGLTLWSHLSGAVLIAMLAFGYWKMIHSGKLMHESEEPKHREQELATLTIRGMSCSHCRYSAVEGLKSLPFASRVDVDLKSGRALIGGSDIDSNVVSNKLESLGFTAEGFALNRRDPRGQ